LIDQTKSILRDALQLGNRVEEFTRSTPLLGSIPEFDSMAVVTVLTLMEERFDLMIDDDEISAEIFETIGSLCDFLSAKVDG